MIDNLPYFALDVQGHTIAYQRSGSGETVLMIHGITSYSFIWRKLVSRLEDNYDLIRIDLLGCGRSELSVENDLSLKNHAQLITAFIESLKLDKVHIVGHDLGGGIAQIMVVNNPEKIKSLALLNPVGYDYWPVQPITYMRTPILRQLAMAAFDRGYYKAIIRKALAKEESLTEELLTYFWGSFESPEKKKSFLRFAKCLNANDLLEISGRLKEVNIPSLLLRADKDLYLSREITQRLNDDLKGSLLVEIPDSGHYMQEDSPDEICSELVSFWG